MKVEQFAQIIEIAETGSFSKAARNLFISQPTLSYYVKQVEEEVGFLIFTRTSNGVVPTPQGNELLKHMKRIQKDFNFLENLYHSPLKKEQISLRVAVLNLSWTTNAFKKLVNKYDTCPINFSFLNYTAMDPLLKLVTGCQVDFAVIGILAPYLKLVKAKLHNLHIEYHTLVRYPVKIAVGRKNPLYDKNKPVKLADLYPYTLVSFGNNDEDPQFSVDHALGISEHMHGTVQVNSRSMFYSIIQNSQAVGPVVTNLDELPNSVITDIHIREIEDSNMTAEEGWVKLRRLPLTDIAAELLEDFKQASYV